MASSVSAAEAEVLINTFGESTFDQLKNSQIHALTRLLKSCPEALAGPVSRVEERQYEDTFRQYGINTGRGSIVLYRNLLSAVSTLLPVHNMSKAENTELLTALCRSPNSKLVSVPLFIALTMAWKSEMNKLRDTSIEGSSANEPTATPTKCGQAFGNENSLSPPGSPDGAQQTEASMKSKEERHKDLFNALTMAIPEYMYIFDLIRERLALELSRIDTVSKTIELSEFVHMLRRSRTVIDENKLNLFMDAIKSCSVGAEGVPVSSCGDTFDILNMAGRINARNLMDFCSLCEQGIIFQLPGYAANRAQTMQTRVSSHLLRAVKKAWPAARKALTRQHQQPTVSSEHFMHALHSAGLSLSVDDKVLIWRALCEGTSCKMNEMTIAKLSEFLQGVIEMDSDPNAFNLTPLINRGDMGHAVRKSIPGVKSVFMNDLDLTWHDAAPDQTKHFDGDQVQKSRGHFERKERVDKKNAFPWEEQYIEAGHENSVALNKRALEGAHKHHYQDGEVDVALPWMDHFSNEGTVSTNLHRRIVNRINNLSSQQFSDLVSALKLHSHAQQLNIDRKQDAGRPLGAKDQVDFKNVRGDEHVSRITLRQSLGEAGVHVSPADSAELFTAIARHSTGSMTRLNHGDSIDHPVTMNSVFLWISSVQNCGNSGNEVLQKYKNLIGDQYIPAPSAVSGGAAGSVGGRYLTVPLDGGHEKQYGNSLAATPSSDELNHRKAGKRHFEGVVGQSNETTQDRREGGKKHGGANDTFMESDYNQSYLKGDHDEKRHSNQTLAESHREYEVVPTTHRQHFPEEFAETTSSASEIDRPQQRHLTQQNSETQTSLTESNRGKASYGTQAESTLNNDEGQGAPQPNHEGEPVTHDSVFAFGSAANDSSVKQINPARGRAYNPVHRDIFSNVQDERESKWEPRPLPSWRKAAADRARGGDSASRIFGHTDDEESVPPPASRSAHSTSMLAAKNAQGTLTGAGGMPIGTEDVLAILQTKRASIALTFRRLVAQSDHQGGVVQLKDFVKHSRIW